MNIQEVEQPPAPITESLFKFPLHFTGLNTDRDPDLQCKTSRAASSAVLSLVLACHLYPVWPQVDFAKKHESKAVDWASNGAESNNCPQVINTEVLK